MITVNDPNNPLVIGVFTDDVNNIGNYTVTFNVEAGGTAADPIEFELVIFAQDLDCIDDQVSLSGTPPLSLYYIGEDALPIVTTITQTSAFDCPI